MLATYAFCWVCFSGLVSAEGTRLTSDGIVFPDGTVQKTKATETGTPGRQKGYDSPECSVATIDLFDQGV